MRATCLLSVWFLLQHIISIPRAEFLSYDYAMAVG
jgi:hypothetical protein